VFSIIGLLTGLAGPISSIASKIIDLQAQKQAAKSNQELASINAALEEAHDRKSVLVAEAGNRLLSAITGVGRIVIIFPVGLILNKVLIWDKIVGECLHGNCYTTTISTQLWGVITAVVAFLFMYDMAAKWRK
jgi:hypothetical protein